MSCLAHCVLAAWALLYPRSIPWPGFPRRSCNAAVLQRQQSARCGVGVRGFPTQKKYLIAAVFPMKHFFSFLFCFDKAWQIKRCSRTLARADCLPLFGQEAFFPRWLLSVIAGGALYPLVLPSRRQNKNRNFFE